jgi:hypothetical protein
MLQKAREKWTDEEHNKFVEGLRLHGRQWRTIEGEVEPCDSLPGDVRPLGALSWLKGGMAWPWQRDVLPLFTMHNNGHILFVPSCLSWRWELTVLSCSCVLVLVS